MNRTESIAAIVAAADQGGTIQASEMLALCQSGALPAGRPELHSTMSVESALQALGLSAAEIEAELDA